MHASNAAGAVGPSSSWAAHCCCLQAQGLRAPCPPARSAHLMSGSAARTQSAATAGWSGRALSREWAAARAALRTDTSASPVAASIAATSLAWGWGQGTTAGCVQQQGEQWARQQAGGSFWAATGACELASCWPGVGPPAICGNACHPELPRQRHLTRATARRPRQQEHSSAQLPPSPAHLRQRALHPRRPHDEQRLQQRHGGLAHLSTSSAARAQQSAACASCRLAGVC